jgi:predicted Fe-S protein YdhL (DUF1289 family)
MSQSVEPTVPSPCRDICQLDAKGMCIGCGRTGDEVGEWSRASAARRLQIRELARARLGLDAGAGTGQAAPACFKAG